MPGGVALGDDDLSTGRQDVKTPVYETPQWKNACGTLKKHLG